MNTEKGSFYNFIVIGAGPAGLTAGIESARKGFSVLIIEKGDRAGPKPRGEGMAHMPIVDSILGEGFLPSIGIKSNGGRVWHSPDDLQQFTTYRNYPHYFFEWRKFIDRFIEVVNELNIPIIYGCEVIEAIEQEDCIIGVKYKNRKEFIEKVFGNAILDCSGYEGVIGKHYEIEYEKMNCPIVKCRVSHANYSLTTTPDLQFYFIGNGDLEYFPTFPPAVAYFFPLENGEAEVGLMLRMAQVPNMKTVNVPSEDEIMCIWARIKSTYPGFSDFLKGATVDYEELTYLPNAKMTNLFIPKPGAVLLGDSAGFINPFGSSGLYYAMKMAALWVNYIIKKLKSDTEDTQFNRKLWNEENIKHFNSKFKSTEIFQQVSNMYNLIGAFEYKIFNRLRVSEKINKKWDYITSLLKQA